MPGFASIWRSFLSFVLGSKDYEPEPPEGNAPGTVEYRRKRHEEIRRRREQDGAARLIDPHTSEHVHEETRLVIVSPGRRVGWEIVPLPGGYVLADLDIEPGRKRPRAPGTNTWNGQLREAIRLANFRQHAKNRRYDLQQERRRAERLDAEMERKFTRAVAREQREKQ